MRRDVDEEIVKVKSEVGRCMEWEAPARPGRGAGRKPKNETTRGGTRTLNVTIIGQQQINNYNK